MGRGSQQRGPTAVVVRRSIPNATPPQQYILDWEKKHAAVIAQFKKDNPDNSDPSPSDLAMVFFETFSRETPASSRRR